MSLCTIFNWPIAIVMCFAGLTVICRHGLDFQDGPVQIFWMPVLAGFLLAVSALLLHRCVWRGQRPDIVTIASTFIATLCLARFWIVLCHSDFISTQVLVSSAAGLL